jgi:protoporphyrinogen oxidase
MKIGILGGGISGLALGYFLRHEYEILEKESECGGLCRSFQKNGFTYDQGGHIIFSQDSEILNLELELLADNVHQRYRNNKIWYKNQFVKYPFENGLYALDKEDIFDCLYHYLTDKYPQPTNLKEWCYATFGRGIAERYLLPYNHKIWNIHPAKMGLEWVERIPKPPLEDVLKSAIGIETEGYTHQLYFYYPQRGGIQSLVQAFENKVRSVRRNFAVQEVHREGGSWVVVSARESRRYDLLVSTIPVFDLVSMLHEVSEEMQRAVDNLRYNSLIVILLGLSKPDLVDLTALYVPDPSCLAHRLCFNKYFSDDLVPEGCSSIIGEISVNPGDGVYEMSDSQLTEQLIRWLSKEGFILPEDVCETDVRRIKYAYPVYDLDYTANTDIIRRWYEEVGIRPLGRFAEFIYINMDSCIRNAKNLAEELNSL